MATLKVAVGPRRRQRILLTDAAVLVLVAVMVVGLTLLDPRHQARQGRPISVRLAELPGVRPLPVGFLGLSLEYPALEAYAGSPGDANRAFVGLLRGLAPAGGLVLRIGGKSADTTWWPVPGMEKPPGVRRSLSAAWVSVASAVRSAVGARLLLGLNLEADNPELAAYEQRQLGERLGSGAVTAWELGNEPDLYGQFAWYRVGDRAVHGRPKDYGFSSYLGDVQNFAGALGSAPLAGPSSNNLDWAQRLSQFLAVAPSIHTVTLHRYPLQLCYIPRRSRRYPTIAHLLSPSAAVGFARYFTPYATVVHAHGGALRVDELNTVGCGAVPAVSRSFAAALWAPDALFQLAAHGVDGVNIHTFPGAGYELFRMRRGARGWQAAVSSEYLGLLLFARAAPAGSRLLGVAGPAQVPRSMRVWGTRGMDGRVRVVVINDDARLDRRVAVRVDGVAGGNGAVQRLRAPGLRAVGGATLGGRSFGEWTATGVLAPPRVETVTVSRGRFVLDVPAASAALVTVGR